jgi:hypothetical protein
VLWFDSAGIILSFIPAARETNVTRGARLWLFLVITLILIAISWRLPRIPQDPTYHAFADQRAFWGIPHTWDVLSNFPFAIVGAVGLAYVLNRRRSAASFENDSERLPYVVVFAGVALTAIGSAYYHLAPDNARLFWDRLPMTVVFTALIAAFVVDRVSVKLGLILLPPLLLSGVACLWYWRWTELRGVGDLRPYGFIQFYSAAALLLLIALFPGRYTGTWRVFGLVGFYALAKFLEFADKPVFGMLHFVSGHTLKHLSAAAASWWIYLLVRDRRAREDTSLRPSQTYERSESITVSMPGR